MQSLGSGSSPLAAPPVETPARARASVPTGEVSYNAARQSTSDLTPWNDSGSLSRTKSRASDLPPIPSLSGTPASPFPSSRSVPNFTRYMAPLESLKSTPQELKDLVHRVSDADEASRGSPVPAARSRQHQPAPKLRPVVAVKSPSVPKPTPLSRPVSTPARMVRRPRPAAGPVVKPLPPLKPSRIWWFLATPVFLIMALYLACYVKDYTSLGYCDTNRDSNVHQDTRSPCLEQIVMMTGVPGADQLQPVLRQWNLLATCSPCPSHAICESGSLHCEPNYVAKRSFFGLGPLHCVADTERMMRIAEEAARVSRVLRRRKGEVICDGVAKRAENWEEWRKFGLREGEVRKTLESGRNVSSFLKIPS
jgi:hypothetical protein